MIVLLALDIPTKEVKNLTGASKSTLYRISQNGKDVGKLWENLGKTINAKVLSAKVLPNENGKDVGKLWENLGKAKEKEREKEEFPPTPPIEEKEKEKEKIFPSSLTNQRFARDTPQGATQNRGLEANLDTADSPMVVEGVREKPTKKAPLKTMAQLEEETKVRAKDFYYSLVPYVATYGKEMIRDFYDYWSETNKSKTKMRWETEKTWVVNLRLRRWADNNKPQKRRYGTEWSDEDIARQRRADDAARVMQQFLDAE